MRSAGAGLLLLTTLLSGCRPGVPDGLAPVQDFDAQRYLGRWHEIARLDHRFERGLVEVTAEYSRREDGGLDVRNRGWNCEDREWKEANGRAYFTGSPEVAALKVSFFRPFYSGYTVVALDPGYRWAMVAGDDRSYLWILAREPTLPQGELERLVGQAQAWGFPTARLIYPGSRDRCPAG